MELFSWCPLMLVMEEKTDRRFRLPVDLLS
jgi:hypothetical protein